MSPTSFESFLLKYNLSIPKIFSSFPANPFWNYNTYMWGYITKLLPSTQDKITEKPAKKGKVQSTSSLDLNAVERMKEKLDNKNNPLDYFVVYPQFFNYDPTYLDFLKDSHDTSSNLPFDFSKSKESFVFITQAALHKVNRRTGKSTQAFQLSSIPKQRFLDLKSLLSGFLNPSLHLSEYLYPMKSNISVESQSLELQQHFSTITNQLKKQLHLYETTSYPKSFQNTNDSHLQVDQGTQTQAGTDNSALNCDSSSSSLQLSLKDLVLEKLSKNELFVITNMLLYLDDYCKFSYPSDTIVTPGRIVTNPYLSSEELESLQDLQKDVGRQMIYVHKGSKITLAKIMQGLIKLSDTFAPLIANIIKNQETNEILSFDFNLPKCTIRKQGFGQDNCLDGIKPFTFIDYQSILPADLERINHSIPFTQEMQDASENSLSKHKASPHDSSLSNSAKKIHKRVVIPFLDEITFFQPAFLASLFSLPLPTFSSYLKEFLIETYSTRENPLYTTEELSDYFSFFQRKSLHYYLSHQLKTSSLVIHSCIYHAMLITRFYFGFRLDQFKTLPQLAKAVYLNRFFALIKNDSKADSLSTLDSQTTSIHSLIYPENPNDHTVWHAYTSARRNTQTDSQASTPTRQNKKVPKEKKNPVIIERQPMYNNIQDTLQELQWTVQSFDNIFGSCTTQLLLDFLNSKNNRRKPVTHQEHLQNTIQLRMELDRNLLLAQKTKAIQDAYYPGHVEVYQAKVEKGYHYDYNSLYPFIMKSYDMPVGVPTSWNGQELNQCFGYLKVRVTSPDLQKPILPVKIANENVIYPNGTWEAWYFSEEIKFAAEKGYQVEILQGYLYSRFPGKKLFGSFIDNFNKTKSTSLQELLEQFPKDLKISSPDYHSFLSHPFHNYSIQLMCSLRKELSKLIMNSVYGKVAQHKIRFQTYLAGDLIATTRSLREFADDSILQMANQFYYGEPFQSKSSSSHFHAISKPFGRYLGQDTAPPSYPRDNYKVNGIINQIQSKTANLPTRFQLISMPLTRKEPISQDFSTKLSPDQFTNGANLAIGAAITAYARILMHKTFLCDPSIDVAYMDTDCVVTTAPLPHKLLSQNQIGKLKNVVTHERSKQNLPVSSKDEENYFTQGYFPNTRSYGYLSHFNSSSSSDNSNAPFCHTTSIMGPVKQDQSIIIYSHLKQLCNTIFSDTYQTTYDKSHVMYRKEYKRDPDNRWTIFYSNKVNLGVTVFIRYKATIKWLQQSLPSANHTIQIPYTLTSMLNLRRFYLYTTQHLTLYPRVPSVYYSLPLTISLSQSSSSSSSSSLVVNPQQFSHPFTYQYTSDKLFMEIVTYNPSFHGPIHNIVITNSQQYRTIAQILYLKDICFICGEILDDYNSPKHFWENIDQWVAEKLKESKPTYDETPEQYKEREIYWRTIAQAVARMITAYRNT